MIFLFFPPALEEAMLVSGEGMEKAGMGCYQLQPNIMNSLVFRSSDTISSSIFKFVGRL